MTATIDRDGDFPPSVDAPHVVGIAHHVVPEGCAQSPPAARTVPQISTGTTPPGTTPTRPWPARRAACAPALVTGADVAAAITLAHFVYRAEDQLQEGIAAALTAAGMPVTREVRLTARDRVDLLTGRVGVEVKVAGAADAVLRQLQRYATSDRIDELVLVTTRAHHRALPTQIGGKPLTVIALRGVA